MIIFGVEVETGVADAGDRRGVTETGENVTRGVFVARGVIVACRVGVRVGVEVSEGVAEGLSAACTVFIFGDSHTSEPETRHKTIYTVTIRVILRMRCFLRSSRPSNAFAPAWLSVEIAR